MTALVAAQFVGVFFATVASLFVKPDRPLVQRIRPYTLQSRSQLGADVDLESSMSTRHTSGSLGSLIASPFRAIAERTLETAIDVTDGPEELTLRLRRAGHSDADPITYRRLQTRFGLVGVVLLGLVATWFATVVGQSLPAWAAAGGCLGFAIGAVIFRLYLQSKADSRAKTLKLEAYSVALLLATVSKLGLGPVVSVRRVGNRASGELAEDIHRGLQWLASGSSTRETLDRLARESPDPSCTRLFRTLGAAADSGQNAGPILRSQAEELRKERREQLDQLATKRRTAMLIPTMVFMFPVIVLYALAPGPSILFGG